MRIPRSRSMTGIATKGDQIRKIHIPFWNHKSRRVFECICASIVSLIRYLPTYRSEAIAITPFRYISLEIIAFATVLCKIRSQIESHEICAEVLQMGHPKREYIARFPVPRIDFKI